MKCHRNQAIHDWRLFNRRLQKFTRRVDIKARIAKLHPSVAQSTFTVERCPKVRMVIDTDLGGMIPCYIHELLHIFFDDNIGHLSYTIQEPMVQAIETHLYAFLQRDKRRMDWWRNEVRSHLRGGGS